VTGRPDGQAGTSGAGIGRRLLGSELRQLREAAGVRLDDAAAAAGVAASTLSRIELGKAPARAWLVEAVLGEYGVTDGEQCRRLASMAREGWRREWYDEYRDMLPLDFVRYLSLEAAASDVRVFSACTVPGLLQAPDYAAAVARAALGGITAQQARRLAAIAGRRQEITRNSQARLHAVINEAALRRPAGSAATMAVQLRHLAAVIADNSATVQVAALSAPLPVLTGSFAVLGFPDGISPDVACASGPGGKPVLVTREREVSALRDAFEALARSAMAAGPSGRLIAALIAP
jgi:transcriptional regulator with XRE-family HTH domain